MSSTKSTIILDKHHKINANDLISVLDGKLLAQIATDTNVDFHARKLKGATMLKLIMEGILMFDNNLSLGNLKSYYESDFFVNVSNAVNGESISKAAISKRMRSLNPDFSKQLYESAAMIWGNKLDDQHAEIIKGLDIEAVDSTMVRESARILKHGISVGRKGSNENPRLHVKYTVGFNGKYATEAIVRTIPRYADEDNALGEAIISMTRNNPFTSEKSIYVFDRGIKGGDLIASFESGNIRFVGRMNSNRRLYYVSESEAPVGELPENSTLIKDQIVRIYGKDHHKLLSNKFRVVSVDLGYEIGRRAGRKRKGERVLTLITDELKLSVAELLEIYRFRWKIEVFFKYLKQHFDLSHLMSGSEIGLTNMIYLSLLTALLVKTYCFLNSTRASYAQKIIWMELGNGIGKYIREQCHYCPHQSLDRQSSNIPTKIS